MGEPPPCCPLSQPPGGEGETPSPTPHLSTGIPPPLRAPTKKTAVREPPSPLPHNQQGGPLTGFLISLSRRRRCSSAALRGMTSGCGSLRGLGGRGAEGAAILPPVPAAPRPPPAVTERDRAGAAAPPWRARPGRWRRGSALPLSLQPCLWSSAPSPWGFGKGEGRVTACPSRSSAFQQPVVSCWGGKTCYMRDPPHTHRNTSGAPGHGEGCEEEAGGSSRPRCSLFGGFPEPLLCFPVPTSKLASPKAVFTGACIPSAAPSPFHAAAVPS